MYICIYMYVYIYARIYLCMYIDFILQCSHCNLYCYVLLVYIYIRVYMTVCAFSHLLPLPRFATQHVQQRNQQLLSSSEYQACRSHMSAHMNSSVEIVQEGPPSWLSRPTYTWEA